MSAQRARKVGAPTGSRVRLRILFHFARCPLPSPTAGRVRRSMGQRGSREAHAGPPRDAEPVLVSIVPNGNVALAFEVQLRSDDSCAALVRAAAAQRGKFHDAISLTLTDRGRPLHDIACSDTLPLHTAGVRANSVLWMYTRGTPSQPGTEEVDTTNRHGALDAEHSTPSPSSFALSATATLPPAPASYTWRGLVPPWEASVSPAALPWSAQPGALGEDASRAQWECMLRDVTESCVAAPGMDLRELRDVGASFRQVPRPRSSVAAATPDPRRASFPAAGGG